MFMQKVNIEKLLCVRNLTIEIGQLNNKFFPVQDINFEIDFGKTLALVGESGSGKTLTALALLGLLPKQARQVNGEIYFKNQLVSAEDNFQFQALRGKHIAMLFQNALSALNPVFRIGTQLIDVLKTNQNLTYQAAKSNIFELFDQVGLDEHERIFTAYPHQLSGGMAQRVLIAMALSCRPELIIADEPTTALDVSTQTQILQLISSLQKSYNFSMLLISHDLHVVSTLADYIMVMRNGKILEENLTELLFASPQHPYTRELVEQ